MLPTRKKAQELTGVPEGGFVIEATEYVWRGGSKPKSGTRLWG